MINEVIIRVVVMAISGILILGLSFAGYVILTMRPIKTSQISDTVFVVKDGFVNLFLVKGNMGYIAIDGGVSPQAVKEGLEKLHIDPLSVQGVFITHSDSDHTGGISLFSRAEIFLSDLEEPMILGNDTRKLFGKERSGISPLAQMKYTLLSPEEEIILDGLVVKAVSVPGHSSGSTAYIINNKTAFVGDMAVVSGKSLSPLPGFINNNQSLAGETAAAFQKKYAYLDFIATGHDGVLYMINRELSE
jgi:hydroxyacylglutathione hydrolase